MLTAARLLRLTLPLMCLGLPFWLLQDIPPWWLSLVSITFPVGSLLFLTVAWRERKDFLSGWFVFIEIFLGILAGLPGMVMANGATSFIRSQGRDRALLLFMPPLWPLLGWATGRPPLGLALGWFNFWGLALILQARPGFLWLSESETT